MPPPPGLKQQLSDRVELSAVRSASQPSVTSPLPGGWWRRWWPALAPATVSLAGAVVLAFQQMEIRDLQESIHTLSKNLPATEATAVVTPNANEVGTSAPGDYAEKEREEIERLKQLVTRLATEVLALEQVQKGNEELRVKLNAPPTLSQEELDAVTKAKEEAMSIRCINTLKQFGLAVRIWAIDNNNVSPPDSLSMSNELGTSKILVCPADTNRVVAKSWETFSPANCSYEYLTPSATNADHEPMRVLSRCPIHGHVGLCDGSVHREVAKKHPDWFQERDGKLYMKQWQ